jgi:ABC-type lipopolysaccharide export system ATPase subunit
MEDRMMTLLRVRGLVKNYGRRRVVDGVDFEVDPGEIVGLLGPNGAGKTTSFRMACGMIEPDAGTVAIADRDVTAGPCIAAAVTEAWATSPRSRASSASSQYRTTCWASWRCSA